MKTVVDKIINIRDANRQINTIDIRDAMLSYKYISMYCTAKCIGYKNQWINTNNWLNNKYPGQGASDTVFGLPRDGKFVSGIWRQ